MNKMSDEQRQVLDFIRAGHNVVVDACAGSGKSTTILSIAKEMPGRKILQFTYNAMLRHEIKEKIKELDLKNILVHTYHSFAVNYYSEAAHTDTGIRQLLNANTCPRIPFPKVDIVVLDEAQDMSPLYFRLIVKMAKDMCSISNSKFQLLVLGDYMQGLYEFKGADIRFLTKADEVWRTLPFLQSPIFKKCTLKMSYRITNQMAKFVNRDMLGEDRLLAGRDGIPVVYIRRPRFQIEKIVTYQITRLLSEGESPSDIFVLGGSVKGVNSNIRHMENTLTENNIPCHVPLLEADVVDERVIDGKVVFSTFHTVKGRQRKYVFIVGFDQGYFYCARNIPKHICPNTLYVACTRATHGLYLLENDSSRPLEFLKQTQPQMKQCDYIDFKGMPQTFFQDNQEPTEKDSQGNVIVLIPTYYVTPTDLIKFVSEPILEWISPLLDKIFVQESIPTPESEIQIPKILQTGGGLFEDVSDLNGIAIPMMIFDELMDNSMGQDALRQMIDSSVQEMRENSHSFLKTAVKRLPDKCTTPSDYLYLANVYIAVQEKLYSKLKQIKIDEYNWLTPEMMDKCKTRLRENIGFTDENTNKNIEIEKLLIHHSQEMDHGPIDVALYPYFSYETRFRFSARIDLLTESTLWELKCTSKITIDHLLQVVIYAWLWRILNPTTTSTKEKVLKILNIRTGEILRLDATTEELTKIVAALLEGKYGKMEFVQDEDFVSQCTESINSVNL